MFVSFTLAVGIFLLTDGSSLFVKLYNRIMKIWHLLGFSIYIVLVSKLKDKKKHPKTS